MTGPEARAALIRNGYCPVHGCKLVTPREAMYFDVDDFCPTCEYEAEIQARADVTEAKRVLGLDK